MTTTMSPLAGGRQTAHAPLGAILFPRVTATQTLFFPLLLSFRFFYHHARVCARALCVVVATTALRGCRAGRLRQRIAPHILQAAWRCAPLHHPPPPPSQRSATPSGISEPFFPPPTFPLPLTNGPLPLPPPPPRCFHPSAFSPAPPTSRAHGFTTPPPPLCFKPFAARAEGVCVGDRAPRAPCPPRWGRRCASLICGPVVLGPPPPPLLAFCLRPRHAHYQLLCLAAAAMTPPPSPRRPTTASASLSF